MFWPRDVDLGAPGSDDMAWVGFDTGAEGQNQASDLGFNRGSTSDSLSSESNSDDSSQDERDGTMCFVCTEKEQVTRRLRCNHHICRKCLRRTVEEAIMDRTRWPPRCCHDTPGEDDIAWVGDPEMLAKYLAISKEMAIVDPTYCSRLQCSQLLEAHDADQEGMITCNTCKSRTCVKCKQGPHQGPNCEKMLDLELERTAKENRWQKCKQCGRIISILDGCPRIRCLCGDHFCYHCGERWLDCSCDGFFPTSPRPVEGTPREAPSGLYTYPSDPIGDLISWPKHHHEYHGLLSGGPLPGWPAQHSNPYLPHLPSPFRTHRPDEETDKDAKASGAAAADGHGPNSSRDTEAGMASERAPTTVHELRERYGPLLGSLKAWGKDGRSSGNDNSDDNGYSRPLQPPSSSPAPPPPPPPRPRPRLRIVPMASAPAAPAEEQSPGRSYRDVVTGASSPSAPRRSVGSRPATPGPGPCSSPSTISRPSLPPPPPPPPPSGRDPYAGGDGIVRKAREGKGRKRF